MTKSARIFLISLVVIGCVPNLVFAAWWNPVSWSFWPWNQKNETVQEVRVEQKSAIATTTDTEKPKQVQTSKPAPVKVAPPKPQVSNPVSVIQDTQQGVTDTDRARFSYKGKTYQQTLDQLIAESSVNREFVIKSMQENEAFKLLMEEMMNRYELALQQSIQSAQAECIAAPTPESERIYDPTTQDYLRKVRCGTATDADRLNYTISQIKPVTVTQTIQAPQFNFPQGLQTQSPKKWQIRWEGNGVGTIITSGGQQRFHCESSGCRSY